VSLEWTLLALRLLAVAVLYAFLIIVVYIIWRDLRAVARVHPQSAQLFASADESASFAGQLRVIGGEAALQPGGVYTFQSHALLGRAPDNHIVLPDASVSSYHARLDRRDGEWWLTDLGSRNGTRLNGVPITKSVPLADGDVIGIGRVELKLETEK
jgi:hypothetical protein